MFVSYNKAASLKKEARKKKKQIVKKRGEKGKINTIINQWIDYK